MSQQLGCFPLRQVVLANQGGDDPRLFEQVDTVAQTVQPVDRRFGRSWISVDQPRTQRVQSRHLPGCLDTLEAVDQHPGIASRPDYQRRDLSITAQ